MVHQASSAALRQRGFTLLEIMIAVSIASVVMLFIFNIQFRMQDSYGVQSKVSDLQFTLQSVQSMIDREAKQAGYLFPNGFRTDFNGDLDGDGTLDFPFGLRTGGELNAGVQVFDGGTNAPDQVRFFTANSDMTQRIGTITCTSADTTFTTVMDDGSATTNSIFPANSLVLVTNSKFDPDDDPGTLPLSVTEACMGRVVVVSTTSFRFIADATPACSFVCANHADAGTNAVTRAYQFRAAGYRVMPVNIGGATEGVLQRSPTGGMGNDWQDIALGFIDYQVRVSYVRTNNYPVAGYTPPAPAYQPVGFATVVTPLIDIDVDSGIAGGTPCDINQVGCNNTNWRAGAAFEDLVTTSPAQAGGNDIQLTDVSFFLFAQSLSRVGGITATELAAAGNRPVMSTAYLSGSWMPTKSRAIRFLSWKSDLRNMGVGY